MANFDWTGFYLPLALYTLTMSATPGPNNLMLTASGAAFGFRRTVPHILGIAVGFAGLVAVVALGLGAVFARYPAVQVALEALGCAYLLYLAYRVATTRRGARAGEATSRPLTFLEGALFQFANPKAWVAVITAVGAFAKPGPLFAASAVQIGLVSVLVNVPSTSLWAGFGVALGRLLEREVAFRAFHLAMGALLAGCVALVVAG